jgi:pimeloyl-ACP methyl ester carboxylesterase
MRHALALALLSLAACGAPAVAAPVPVEGFVAANGVRLQYFDWGGTGRTLLLVHGLADNPHVFDDLAPAFTDRFHVIAPARRASGSSEARGPYDVVTLTEDLRAFMDALGIEKAHLVGVSAGGEEITRMAARYPERVGRIVYLEAGYDFTDTDFKAAVAARPFAAFARPAAAMASLDAYRSYVKAMWYPGVDDMRRMEANLRAKVVMQRDGTLQDRTPAELVDALYAAILANEPREYSRIRSAALAIYADRYYDLTGADAQRREKADAHEQKYWRPFQEKSIERLRRGIVDVRVEHVRGGHSSFLLMSRQKIVETMREFLDPG